MDSPVLDEITLESGSHNTRANGVCAMEAVAWLAGEKHSDHPKCACPVIAQLVRVWNDSLPEADRQRLLKPLLPLLVGSRSTPEVEERRAYMALDWLVRTHTAAWLRLAKLPDDADALEGLPPITDLETAKAAGVVVRAAQKRAAAAWAASRADSLAVAVKEDAAWPGAGIAAREAAGVIRAASRAAARAAAGDAASEAAGEVCWNIGEATGATAESAGAAAVGSVSWAAAYRAAKEAAEGTTFWDSPMDMAGIASGGAAWAAARNALRPTEMELQDSCADLIRRMAAIRG